MTKKIKYILLFGILIILGLCTKSQARITTSDPTVKSGGTVTITINSQEPVSSGSIDVTSDGGLTFVDVKGGQKNGTRVAFAGSENMTSGIATYTFKAPNVSKTTTYRVTFASYDMANIDGEEVASSNATATVTVEAEETTDPGDDNNQSGGGNSGGGNSGGSGSGGSSEQGGSSGGNGSSSGEEVNLTFTSVNEKVYATESGVNIRESYSTSSRSIGSLETGQELTRTGVATRAVNGITWSRIQYNGQTAYVSSSYLTTEAPEEEEKSNNKNLRSLTLGGGFTLTPDFSPSITEYSLVVGSDVDSIEVNAQTEDDMAKVEVIGNDNLLMGENTVTIRVTAEDGTVRTYTINVTKDDTAQLALSELSIEGFTLSPEFSSSVHEYTLDITSNDISSLNISANANDENATIEIVGNENFKIGENIITILVKSEEGSIVTYQIVVNLNELPQEEQIIAGIDNEDLYMYGGIALAVIVVIIIIIIIAVKRRHKNDDDFQEYYGGLDSLYNDDKAKNEDAKTTESLEASKDLYGSDVNNYSNNIDNSNVDINNMKDSNITNADSSDSSRADTKYSDRKSVIEENFGDNINTDNWNDDQPKKKKGKHF